MAPKRSTRKKAKATSTPAPTPPPATTPPLDSAALEVLIAQRVADALASYEASRPPVSGQGGGGGVIISQGINTPNGPKACTYKSFMDCKPRSFYGDEGVVGLSRWIEKMELVFHISFCTEDCRVKFASCTFQDAALTWWNDHSKTMGIDAAYAISWEDLKLLLLAEYCPRAEIQKLEEELWNLTMKGGEIAAYTARFNDLSALCPSLVTPAYKKIERYIWGLAPEIQGMVTSSKPDTYSSAKILAYTLTDQEIRRGTLVRKDETVRTGDNKRKSDGDSRGNERQSSWKKQDTAKAYAATTTPQQQYPKCNKCNYHHLGECKFCERCNKGGHIAKYCRSPTPATDAGTGSGGKRGCYDCGDLDHIKRNCPKRQNQGGGGRGRAFFIGAPAPEGLG